MPGRSIAHGALAASAIGLLDRALRGTCTVLSSDVRIRIESTGLTTFPDASVVCGDVVASETDRHAVTNPTLLIEVTSPSTEDDDRGDELSNYKQIPSLRGVLFISHRTPAVTLLQRDGNLWREQVARAGELLELDDPHLSLAVDDVYAGISLDPA